MHFFNGRNKIYENIILYQNKKIQLKRLFKRDKKYIQFKKIYIKYIKIIENRRFDAYSVSFLVPICTKLKSFEEMTDKNRNLSALKYSFSVIKELIVLYLSIYPVWIDNDKDAEKVLKRLLFSIIFMFLFIYF